jgi:hypothetical protein
MSSRAGRRPARAPPLRSQLGVLTRLSSLAVALFVSAIIFGATGAGIVAGRALARRKDGLKEPLGIIQGALVGLVALLLAFGLSMAVGRYQSRRDALVLETNAIGTTYLRAQTLSEPMRSDSLALLKRYADARIALSESVPDSAKFRAASRTSVGIQNRLWALAGRALNEAPIASAPRLYVETLNEMIDAHTTRVAALDNRIPAPVLWLQILASAVALGVLGMYLASHERGVLMALLAAGLVTIMLLVIVDLDRPHRGLITIPDGPLVALRESMNGPPAAPAPQP